MRKKFAASKTERELAARERKHHGAKKTSLETNPSDSRDTVRETMLVLTRKEVSL
jgi:hypothetical protein